jgi:hypothetical protein
MFMAHSMLCIKEESGPGIRFITERLRCVKEFRDVLVFKGFVTLNDRLGNLGSSVANRFLSVLSITNASFS